MVTGARRHLALVGATASGKTALALSLAERRGGIELVSADAIAVYRGLDIGSAKPTPAERARVRWHLLDVVAPDEEYSAWRFCERARAALVEIEGRGAQALLVGGTGLYQRALIDDLRLAGRYREVAAGLEAEAAEEGGLERLYAKLVRLDPLGASRIEPGNQRRIVRALEVTLGSGVPFSANGPGLATYPASRFVQIGLRLERDELDRRIERRVDEQLATGFVAEVAALAAKGGLSRTVRQAIGYRELLAHLEEGLDLATARAEILRRTRAFARRQLSWFGRDPRIRWIDATSPRLLDEALELLA